MRLPSYDTMVTSFLVMTCVVITQISGVPTPSNEDPGSFWFGTQDLNCLKDKTPVRRKRSLSPSDYELERSTIAYAHRMLYYRGYVFEWGAGTKGYHFGQQPAISDCSVEWETEPAGTSECDTCVLRNYTEHYRARYGGYNLVTNNCHHFANRVGILLQSKQCQIGEDKWMVFNRKFRHYVLRFMSIFNPGSSENAETGEEGNPHRYDDWPKVQWYRK